MKLGENMARLEKAKKLVKPFKTGNLSKVKYNELAKETSKRNTVGKTSIPLPQQKIMTRKVIDYTQKRKSRRTDMPPKVQTRQSLSRA
jgi:hypothetical protein